MRSKKSGLTIMEIVVVSVIVATVVALFAFVLVSRVRESALKAVAKNRLRQTSIAINLYMLENDAPPVRLQQLTNVEFWSPVNKVPFLYSHEFGKRAIVRKWLREFEPSSDPILRDMEFPLKDGPHDVGRTRNADGVFVSHRIYVLKPGENPLVLAGYLDGSVRYGPLFDTFFEPVSMDEHPSHFQESVLRG